jgi:hypothetical protein
MENFLNAGPVFMNRDNIFSYGCIDSNGGISWYCNAPILQMI